MVRRALQQNRELRSAFDRAWPVLEADDLVGDLWSVPAYLRRCAPGLDAEEVRRLQRAEPTAWTVSDLPLLDAARLRLGDPDASRRRRQREAALAAEREEMAEVVDHLIETDDSEMHVMSMLRGEDLSGALVDETAGCRAPTPTCSPARSRTSSSTRPRSSPTPSGRCCWPGARRAASPSSATAPRRGTGSPSHGRSGSARIGLDRVTLAPLSINYRTPEEVMAEAEPVIRAVLPGRQRAHLGPRERPPRHARVDGRPRCRSSTRG